MKNNPPNPTNHIGSVVVRRAASGIIDCLGGPKVAACVVFASRHDPEEPGKSSFHMAIDGDSRVIPEAMFVQMIRLYAQTPEGRKE